MKGITHLTVGTVSGIALAIIMHPEEPLAAGGIAVATMIGSIFPDIDNSKSMMGSKIKPISYLISKLFGHRGFIHTPFNLLCIMILTVFPMFLMKDFKYLPIAIGFCAGFISHLLLDSITKGGIAFLYPFTKKRFNLTTIKTGGLAEHLIIVAFLLLSGGIAASAFIT